MPTVTLEELIARQKTNRANLNTAFAALAEEERKHTFMGDGNTMICFYTAELEQMPVAA